MIDVLVDEFTLVLQSKTRPNFIEEWDHMANIIINKFISLSKVEIVLSELEESNYSLPMGYTNGLICTSEDYYFSIGYHEDFVQMGICIKFSAHSWAKYRYNYKSILGEEIEIHDFLKMVNKNDLFTSRLSRIDIAIDFINENNNINPNTIYNQLSKKNQIVKTANGRKNHSYLSAITKNNFTSTFYLGSKGKNINALLRVYDKKLEQMETFGYRYQEAVNCDSWVRFEASYKGTYAHSLSEKLNTINNANELKNLLVSALIDRYQFYYTKSDKQTIFTKKMIDLLIVKDFKFTCPSPRNNLLEQSQRHILRGSGLFPYLYKVYTIWGNEGLIDCLNFIYDEFGNYVPNDDVIAWIRKYSELYKIQGMPF